MCVMTAIPVGSLFQHSDPGKHLADAIGEYRRSSGELNWCAEDWARGRRLRFKTR
jgi:hypothetical protein